MKRTTIALAAAVLMPAAHAAGIYLYEIGTDDVGLSAAGSAARAQDAAVMFTNPAGLARIDGRTLVTGAQALYGDVKYTLSPDAALQGSSPGNIVGWFPSASAFYSQRIDPRLTVGLGIYGNFGLGLHYGDWAGAALVKDATLVALTVLPSLAWRVDAHWSVGAALGLNYGVFALKRQGAAGEQTIRDTAWAPGVKLGVLFEADDATRFGLAYNSAVKYDFAADTLVTLSYTVDNPVPSLPDITITRTFSLPLEGMVNAPQQLMASAFRRLDARWAVMGNLGWADWSAYSHSAIRAAGHEVPGNDRLRDTWHVALGAQYLRDAQWRFDAGIAYDTSIYQSQDDQSLTMPSGAAWRLGVGAKYQRDARNALGAAFEYQMAQGGRVRSAVVGGSFDAPRLYFLSANYTHRF